MKDKAVGQDGIPRVGHRGHLSQLYINDKHTKE
jgi:hypothetical protein